jgi:hypothetical protein
VNLLFVLEERANSFDFFPVYRVEERGAAKFLEDVVQGNFTNQDVVGFTVAVRRQGEYRNIAIQSSQQFANPFLPFGVSQENNSLIDVAQFKFFIRFFFEEVAIADFSPGAFDLLCGGAVLDDEQQVGLFGGDIAQEAKKQVVFADCEILHNLFPSEGNERGGLKAAEGRVFLEVDNGGV